MSVEPAIAGALAGAVLGLAEYVLVTRMIAGALQRTAKTEPDLPGRALVAAQLRPIKVALLATGFAVLPGLGYAIGTAYGR